MGIGSTLREKNFKKTHKSVIAPALRALRYAGAAGTCLYARSPAAVRVIGRAISSAIPPPDAALALHEQTACNVLGRRSYRQAHHAHSFNNSIDRSDFHAPHSHRPR